MLEFFFLSFQKYAKFAHEGKSSLKDRLLWLLLKSLCKASLTVKQWDSVHTHTHNIYICTRTDIQFQRLP